ncbi:MAG: GntG family PLP-dependent aldolase, partial [Eubacteriales bacterium]|nr:GntG family PLP-dependent aldolase [Eubacteriales bacterium]
LETLAAQRLGKEAALFVPTGTMGNQAAIMASTHAGDEIIASARSHIISYEGGAPARLSGVGYALVDHDDGTVHADDIVRLARPPHDNRYPETKLVCLENALYDGRVIPMDTIHATCRQAHACGLRVHMDGARIFNAAAALGVEVKELVSGCDSVMFCVSKGLCSPVGSLLCGDAAFIEKALFMRKLMGGGMREAGILAACGIVSLKTMVDRLGQDHENARLLATELEKIEGIEVLKGRLDINMVFWRTSLPGFCSNEYVRFLYRNGIKAMPESEGEYRYCTHYYVSTEDVVQAARITKAYCDSIR